MREKKKKRNGRLFILKNKTPRWVSLQINKQAMKFLPYLFASSSLASSSAVSSFPSFSSGFEDPLRTVVVEEEEEEEDIEGASGTSDLEVTEASLVDIEIN